jgi:hypothetical protein
VKLSSDDQAEIMAVANRFAPKYKMVVAAFMREFEFDDATVLEKMGVLVKELERDTPSLRAHYLPYVGLQSDGLPKPCGMLLEDCNGGCARDRNGNPICLCYGFDGDARLAISQMKYLMHRVTTMYVDANDFPSITYVFDMIPRQGQHQFQLNLEFMSFCRLFPQQFTFFMCGVSPTVRTAWRAMSRLMPSLDNYKLDNGYGVLAEYMTPENMLPTWHEKGSFDFDLTRYVAFLEASA